MSLQKCMTSAVTAGEMDSERAALATAIHQDLLERYGRAGYDPSTAMRMADEDTLRIVRADTAKRRYFRLHQIRSMRERDRFMEDFRDTQGRKSPAMALHASVEWRHGSGDLEFQRRSYERRFASQMRGLFKAHHHHLGGRPKNPAGLKNVISEIMGTGTGDVAAREIAAAVSRTFESMRQLFNAYGGDIQKLDHWFPQSHNRAKINDVPAQEWVDAIRDRLDWDRIHDFATGKPVGQDADQAVKDSFLAAIRENIVQQGWNLREPEYGFFPGTATYRRHADHRVLHFKSADDWLAYNERFGMHNPFDAIVAHMKTMARDIAMLRVFGPNHKVTMSYMEQKAKKLAAGKPDEENAVSAAALKARAMIDMVSGTANVPGDEVWAARFAAARDIVRSALLGFAPISAIGDFGMQRIAAKSIGMNPGNVLSRTVGLLTSGTRRQELVDQGYVLDTMIDSIAAAARFQQETVSPELTQRITGFTLRANGLSLMTDAQKAAKQVEIYTALGRLAETRFEDIDPLFRDGFLTKHGITPADWDALRRFPVEVTRDGDTIREINPHYFVNAADLPMVQADDIATRLAAAVEREVEAGVPSNSIEGRAILQGSSRPGTFYGELLRSGTSFKGFAMSFTLGQYRDMMARPTPMSRLQHAAEVVGTLTLLGALAIQIKETLKGRDPMAMDDPRFWVAASVQGGGFGILGDFAYSETNRFGSGIAETLAGPVVGLASDAISLPVSNAARLLQGDETYIGRDAVNFADRYLPFQNNWTHALAFDRMVWDSMRRVLDPDAERYWASRKGRMDSLGKSDAWWEEGDTLPDRAPEISGAF